MPAHSDRPSVSVIIPARDAADHIEAAIRSALAQPGVAEVVVAAADPATRAAAEDVDPRVSVVDNPDGSTPVGLNRALAKTSEDVVVRCDAHAVLPAGYVERAAATLERTGAANVGGRQIPVGRTPFEQAVALAMASPIGAGDARYRIGGLEGPVDTVYLGVFRRDALEAVGGFDETLERNQDYELNWRLREKGGLVWFDPLLEVEYRPRSSAGALWKQYFQYGFWKRIVLRRHPGSVRWRQLAPPLLVVSLVGSAAISPIRWWAGAAIPGSYVAVLAAAGVADSIRLRRLYPLLEPIALGAMHLGWGTGFIAGQLSGRR